MDNITIGAKIKNLRKQKGLTQDELAKILGYSGKSVIAHIEKGDADMTYEKMALLLEKFSLDANSLFGEKILEKNEMVQKPKKEGKKTIVYIHGLHGSAKEVDDFKYLKKKYNVIGLDYEDGNPWEVGPVIRDKFLKIKKKYKDIIVIANSIGAFYTYEYLSNCKIERAFFISPIVSMFQSIVDLMMQYNIKDSELKRKKFIKLEDGTMLSYDFYQHVSNDEDSWDTPTDILYGAYDDVVFSGNMLEFLANHPRSKMTVKADSEHYLHSDEEKEFIKKWLLKNLDN